MSVKDINIKNSTYYFFNDIKKTQKNLWCKKYLTLVFNAKKKLKSMKKFGLKSET